MKLSDEMKKDYDDQDPNLQYQAGYESAMRKYIPKVEALEKELEIEKECSKILDEENINFRNVQFSWGEKHLSLQKEIQTLKKECGEECNEGFCYDGHRECDKELL